MPFQIGSIVAKIGIDTGALKQQIADAKAQVKAGADAMAKALDQIGSSQTFTGLNNSLKGVSQSAQKAAESIVGFGTKAQRAAISAADAFTGAGFGIKRLKDAATEAAEAFKGVGLGLKRIKDASVEKTAQGLAATSAALKGVAENAQKAAQGIGNVATSSKDVAASFSKSVRADIASRSAALRSINELRSGFAQAGAALQQLQAKAQAAPQGLLNRQNAQQLAASFGTGLRSAVDTVGSAFVQLGRGAQQGLSLLASAVKLPINAFKSLLSSIFSIRSALATFGVVKIFERAGEVDNLRVAFDTLSKSIGALSDRFLKRLREATRGTISDLELMRVTNNAILLGAARSADQFVELAEAARRLGQATGRSATQALEDLSLGIGRQSRLLLDNLGIIAKAEQAYEKYALSIGKAASKLTQTEQRFAFQKEVLRAIRERLATLGPDVETVGQAVQRLGATISNVFSDISTSLVSRNAVAGLADLLDQNRPKIAAFVSFVRDKVDQIVSAFITGFDRLKSGDLNIADFLSATFGTAFRFLARTISAAVTNLVPVFLKAGLLLGEQLVEGVLTAIRRSGIKVKAALRSFFGTQFFVDEQIASRAQESFDAADKAFAALSRAKILSSEELNRIAKELGDFGVAIGNAIDGGKRLTEQQLDDIITLRARLENALRAPSQVAAQQEFARSIEDAFKRTGETISDVVSDTAKDVDHSLGVLTGSFASAAAASKKIRANLRENIRDPLAGVRPIQVDRFVQPLADAVNKVIELRQRLLLSVGKFIPDSVVRASAIPVEGLVSLVEKAQDLSRKLQEFFKPPELEEQAFLQVFSRLEENLQKLNFDAVTAGADAGTVAVQELTQAFDGLFHQLSPRQSAQVERLATQLRDLASVADAAKAVANLRKELEDFGLTAGEIAARDISRSIAKIKLSDAFNIDGAAVQAQFEKFKLSEALKKDQPQVKAQLDSIAAGVQKAFETGTGFEDQIRSLSLVIARLETAQEKAAPDVKSQLAGLADSLAVVKENLDAALDAHDAVAKLRAQLESLSDISIALKIKVKIKEIQDDIQKLEDQVTDFGLTTAQVITRKINQQISAIQVSGASDALIAARVAELERARTRVDQAFGQLQFQELTKGLSTSVLSGIVEGFERGESAAKIWAGVVSDIFRNSMQKVIDGLTNTISKAFGNVFSSLGLGVGAADFATGLIGVGSSILVGLKNRRDQTVNDFSQQVNSSEAIRGVVAGPTNVAIAKVGDQLKTALRTTEILLTRIAISVERGGGGGAASAPKTFSTRLTPSTQS